MPAALDLSGQRFGRLVALDRVGTNRHGKPIWRCQCDCGCQTETLTPLLRNGHARSCGCLQLEAAHCALAKITRPGFRHGRYGTPLYKLWLGVKARCLYKSATGYEKYGGRGIGMYAEWLSSFEAFAAYFDAKLGPRPPSMTLDRIDNDGDYEPGNVRWATPKQQRANQREAANCLATT